MDVAEATVAEDAENVAGFGSGGDVGDDFVGCRKVVSLVAGGADVFQEFGRIEPFVSRDLLKPGDFGDDDALGQA